MTAIEIFMRLGSEIESLLLRAEAAKRVLKTLNDDALVEKDITTQINSWQLDFLVGR